MTSKKIVLSFATALLLSSPGLADDRLQARDQGPTRGGLVNNLPGATEPSSQASQAPAPATRIEEELPLPPEVEPELPIEAPVAVAPSQQLPGALGEAPSLPIAAPEQGFPVTEVGPQQGPSQSERPGFFKRMWAKVKTFASKVRDKLRRAPRAEVSAPAIDYQSGGGGDGGSSGGASD